MKYLFFIPAAFLLYSCSLLQTEPFYVRRHPGSHILTTNKKVIKDNMKYHREHEKAARKRREELATYLQGKNVTTEKSQKKK